MTHPHLDEYRRLSCADLEAAAEISQEFAVSLDPQETIRNALERSLEYLEAEAGSLFLLDGAGERLVCRACHGPVDITGISLPLDRGIAAKAVRSRQCQIVRDVAHDPDFSDEVDRTTGFRTRSILYAPLLAQGECLGVLEVINKHGNDGLFDEGDRHLLVVLAAAAAAALRNARMAAELLEQGRVRQELALAGEIQRSMLPPLPPVEWPVHGVNVPARGVSGDFYQFFPLPDGRFLFGLGDVSGKGIHAALFMAKIASLFRALGRMVPAPGALLARLNEELRADGGHGMFVTLVAGLYDPASGELRFANAGHEPPLLRDAGGGYRDFVAEAPPLGIVAGLAFPEVRVVLDGGVFYLFSDGLTEGLVGEEARLTVEGVKGLIERYAVLPPDERVLAMVEHLTRRDGALHDDITLVVVEGCGGGG